MPATDLDIKYRPCKLSAVVGQSAAVETIRGFKAIPRALLFEGTTGAGKTTMARIVATELLKCDDSDYVEVNCGAVDKPLDWTKELKAAVTSYGLGGNVRVWTLDEFQTFSRAKSAQESMLGVLESSPDHVYFILCTTDPQRILPAVRNRCVRVVFKDIPAPELVKLVKAVAEKENADPPVSDKLAQKIARVANGSARTAIKELQKVIDIPDPAVREAAVSEFGEDSPAFDLARSLFWNQRAGWGDAARVLEAVKEEDPEGIRRMLLSCARGVLLNGKGDMLRAERVIKSLPEIFLDRPTGHALLVAACYAAMKPPAANGR